MQHFKLQTVIEKPAAGENFWGQGSRSQIYKKPNDLGQIRIFSCYPMTWDVPRHWETTVDDSLVCHLQSRKSEKKGLVDPVFF